jgi:far upstream element-binding protein
MQRKSGAKVQIQKEHEMEPGATMRIITLIGPTAESVATCREIIENMVQERTRINTEHQQQRYAASGGGGGLFSSSGTAGSNATSQAAQLQQALTLGHAHIQMQIPNSDVGLIIVRGFFVTILD